MFRVQFGLGRKLQWLALFNGLAFALITVIVGVAFDRVENLSSGVARNDIAKVIDNATMGRQLSAIFSEIDLISRACHGDASLEEVSKRLSASIVSISRTVPDKELAGAVEVFSATSTQLLGECMTINQRLNNVLSIDRQVQVELSNLENLIGRALISETMAGKTTDYLDQVMTLVTGYRESVLLIGKQIAGASSDYSVDRRGAGSVVRLIDDLSLRLQTLTASPPDIARIGKRLIHLTAAYREEASRFEAATSHFNDALGKSHAAREGMLRSMSRLDQGSAHRIEGASEEIRQIVKESRQRVLGLSAFVALLSLAAILWTIRRSIRLPLAQVIQQIESIQGGEPGAYVPVVRRDEWGAIQAALAHMSDELAKSRDLLQKVIDTAPIRVFWKDRDLRYNPAFARDAGKAGPAELIGKDDYQMAWKEQAELYRDDDRQVIESGTPKLLFEEPQTTPDGGTIWLRTSKVALKSRDNETMGVLGIYDDITERKQAEIQLEQYRRHLEELVQERTAALIQTEAKASLILQSSADGLYGVYREGRISFINPAACRILGHPRDKLIGLPAHETFHHSRPDGSPYPKEDCPSHAAIRSGHEIRVDNEIYWHADGHAIPVMFAVHPLILDGKNDGAVVSFVDMSEQRAVARAREQALAAAEKLARLRSEFLSNMSHEIRTPINGVLGFADIGYRNYRDPEKARNAFSKILTSGKRLLGVINDILNFSKIEAGKLSMERVTVALHELMEQEVEVVRELAQAKLLYLRVEWSADLPRICVGDPLRIGQVLLNLLSNAVKFTETGGVTLSASCENGALIFKVRDTGIGMSEEMMSHLFQPFQQGDGSTSRRFGGTGLGLTIAKRMAELMGGDIGVKSSVGVGSTFEFRLPYIEAEPEATVQEPSELDQAVCGGKPLAGINILVAEDEPINQMVLTENLNDDGASLVMVGNGREAVERVLRDGPGAYDIVLMDVQMPEMDGLEATRRILEMAPNLPIIGQTAHAFEEERQKCFEAGMVGHIAKPIDPDALVKLLLQHVAAARNKKS